MKEKLQLINRNTKPNDFIEPLLWLAAMGLVLLCVTGCSMFGNGAKPPTALEQKFFEVSNTVVPRVIVVTNYSTNVVPVTVVQPVVTYQTNTLGVTQLVTNTTTVQAWSTNVTPVLSYQTNLVQVPQLVAGTGANAVVGIGGAVASPFGFGGLVGTILAGALAGYLKLRNNALAGQASVANQVAGAFTQNIETLLNVLGSTPQGQAALPGIKNFLQLHQAQAGILEEAGTVVANFVDEPAAQQSAAELLKALNLIPTMGSAPTPTPGPTGAKVG